MPIQFRCIGCNQKLAITRRKAGKVVKCPACATEIAVPTLDEAIATGKLIESPDSQPAETSPPPQQSPSQDPPPGDAPAPEEELVDAAPAGDFDDFVEEDTPAFDNADVEDGPPPASFAATSEQELRDDAGGDLLSTSGWLGVLDTDDEAEDEDGFRLQRRGMDESGLDMTPMVDVTFLLLIFFMITATFSLQKSMETEAPEPEDEGAAQLPTMDDLADDSVMVEIDENDAIFVDDVQVAGIGELVDVLELKVASEQKLEMIIDPHPQAKHGTVVQATDAGIEVGMQRIRRVSRKGE